MIRKVGGLAPLAPYTRHRGGMLYRSNMLAIMEGITDHTYLYTLERAIQALGADAKVVAEARAFRWRRRVAGLLTRLER